MGHKKICCCCLVSKSCLTLSEPMNCSTPGSSALLYLPEFTQIHVHWVTDAIYPILCHPLLPLSLVLPIIRVFSSESALHIRWPNYWSFSFSNSPSKEYSGLISFRIDLAVHGTLDSSPPPKFKSINSLALSFLYGSNLTFIHDYWKNHSFD